MLGSPAGVAACPSACALWPLGFATPAFAGCALVGDLRGDPDRAVFPYVEGRPTQQSVTENKPVNCCGINFYVEFA